MLATKFKPRTTTVVIAKAASTSRLDLCVSDTQGGDPTGILPRLSDVLVEGYGGPDRQRYRKVLPAMGLVHLPFLAARISAYKAGLMPFL